MFCIFVTYRKCDDLSNGFSGSLEGKVKFVKDLYFAKDKEVSERSTIFREKIKICELQCYKVQQE